MPAHSRSKNGVASLAYVAGIHVFCRQVVDGRNKSGHDGLWRALVRLHTDKFAG